MNIQEIEAKSVLKKAKNIDSWFISKQGMNLYRGCFHNCSYCDGRAEKYRVEGTFNEDLSVKTNAPRLLDKELDPKRKRKTDGKAYVMLGGGVNDSYQPLEKKYELSRKALGTLKKYHHPVHILTKSTLVKRDFDLIQDINLQNSAILSFSFSTVDENIARKFEPGVPSPSERLKTIEKFSSADIPCGMFLMPVIPYVSDTREKMEASEKAAIDAGCRFIIFGGMTLKEGRQKSHFQKILTSYDHSLSEKYENLYGAKGPYGQAKTSYYIQIQKVFNEIVSRFKIPLRVPAELYQNLLGTNDLIFVILDQMSYLRRIRGQKTHLGKEARIISKLKKPLDKGLFGLEPIEGISTETMKLVDEILETGTSKEYEGLLCL